MFSSTATIPPATALQPLAHHVHRAGNREPSAAKTSGGNLTLFAFDAGLGRPPAGARLDECWVGTVGIGRCAVSGTHLTWTPPTLAGGNTTAGPFGAVVDVSALSAGRFEVTAWVDHPAIPMVTTHQEVWLEKK